MLLAFVRSVGGVHPSREEASRCNGQELRLWSQTRTVQTLFLPLPSCATGSSYFRLRVSTCVCMTDHLLMQWLKTTRRFYLSVCGPGTQKWVSWVVLVCGRP